MDRLAPLVRNWAWDSSLEPSRPKNNLCEDVFCSRTPHACSSARKCGFLLNKAVLNGRFEASITNMNCR